MVLKAANRLVDIYGSIMRRGDYVENNAHSLRSTFSVNGEVSDNDTRFLKVTIDVLNVGANYNGSYFSKEVVDKNIDTIKNTPVLGCIQYDSHIQENDFKGHEYVIKRTDNGVEKCYAGHAYGIIPESCNPRWVAKTTDSGNEVETLRVDALLWEKFSDATSILRRDSEKAQSMELEINSIDGYDDEDDGLFHFTSFSFDGCAILGDGVQPAMENANVKINEVNFSVDEFTKHLQSELNDKFAAFTKLVEENDIRGGVRNMPNPDFSQTVMQQFNDISAAVSGHETIKDYWGDDVARYYAVDIQDFEVIVVDAQDGYNYYSFPFTMDGDKPVIDFACKKRKKVSYQDYEDGTPIIEGAFSFGEHIAAFEKVVGEKLDEANSKVADVESAKAEVESNFEQIKSELDEIKPKYEEYEAAEAQRKADELNAEKDAKFAEYDDALADNADFAAIKEKKGELTVDEIEKECAVIYVKAARAAKSNFSKSTTSPAVGIITEDDDETPDGYANTRYGYIKKSR